jgi:adenosine deaminase
MLRDLSPESAMEHYLAVLPYKDMIIGIGLDSNEYDRPPSLFEELYIRARADGFKLTCHCDVTQKDTHEHIRQVAESVAGTGADRIDHGLDAAQRPDLVALIKRKGIGMTLCPWAYVRHHTEADLFQYIRLLFDQGVAINISSDSPVYVEENWVNHNLLLIRLKCGFTDDEIVTLEKTSVKMSWAPDDIKQDLLKEIESFCISNSKII